MKTILITLITLLSFNLNAQVIDYNNFNTKLVDSLMFVKINEFRDSLGLSQLIYSKVLYDEISKEVSQIQADEMKCYHPYHPNSEKRLSSIKSDLRLELSSTSGYFRGYYEVCDKSVPVRSKNEGYTERLGKIKTYEDLVSHAIRGWILYSPSHKEILMGEFSDKGIMLAAGSIVVGKYKEGSSYKGLYSSFQIVPLY